MAKFSPPEALTALRGLSLQGTHSQQILFLRTGLCSTLDRALLPQHRQEPRGETWRTPGAELASPAGANWQPRKASHIHVKQGKFNLL